MTRGNAMWAPWRPLPPDWRRPACTTAGFTLLEVLVSITILALIMTSLYLAFSTATQLWTRQSGGVSRLQRLETLSRLVSQDLRDAREYTAMWERGQDFFFSGSRLAVFYVTGEGLGAARRQDRELFFACLFCAPNPDDGELHDMYIVKTGVPTRAMLDSLHDFSLTGDEDVSRLNAFSEGGELRAKALLVLPGIKDPVLSYTGQLVEDDGFSGDRAPLSEESWRSESLPHKVRLEFTSAEADYRVEAEVRRWGP